jgi:hypothetical protein
MDNRIKPALFPAASAWRNDVRVSAGISGPTAKLVNAVASLMAGGRRSYRAVARKPPKADAGTNPRAAGRLWQSRNSAMLSMQLRMTNDNVKMKHRGKT